MGILVLLSLSVLNSDDTELFVSCGGDNELGIDCTGGDLQLGNYISGYDAIAPTIIILNPEQGFIYGINASFPLNFSITDVSQLDICTYNVIYEHVLTVISNTTISCITNITFDMPLGGLYTVNMYANDTPYGNLGYNSTDFTLSLTNPAVNLLSPNNNTFKNVNDNITFSFIATDSDGIDTCRFYTDSTGSWSVNQTITDVTSGVIKEFNATYLQDRSHKWNIQCNDTLSFSSFATENRTLTVDTAVPNVEILTVNNVNVSGLTLSLLYNISDININLCFFTLTNETGDLHNYAANTTLNCNSYTISLATLSAGKYNIRIY